METLFPILFKTGEGRACGFLEKTGKIEQIAVKQQKFAAQGDEKK